MSISRQVFSSPFDITTRRDGGVRDRNVNGNIMSDTRVVRRSIFNNTSTPKPLSNHQKQSHSSNPAIKFDRRLLGGGNNSIFANPIVKVSGGNDKAALERRGLAAAPRTPPPVNGRNHVCIQADHESIDKFY